MLASIPLAHGSIFHDQHLPKVGLLAAWAIVSLATRSIRRPPDAAGGHGWSALDVVWMLYLTCLLFSCRQAIYLAEALDSVAYWSLLFLLHKDATGWDQATWRQALFGLGTCGAIAAAYGALQSFYLQPIHTYPSYTSTFGNVNFAAACIALLTVVVGSAVPREKRWQNWWLAAALLVMMFYLIRTGSRAAWLGLVVGMPLYFLLRGLAHPASMTWRQASLSLLAFSLLALLPLCHDGWRAEFQARLSALAHWEEGSLKTRLLVWHGTWKMVGDYAPWGVGSGQFSHHFYRYRDTEEYLTAPGRVVDDPHNEWLRLFAEGGVPAALAFLALVTLMLWRLAATLHAGSAWPNSALLLALLVMLLLMSCVAAPLNWPASGLFFALASAWATRSGMCRQLGLARWGQHATRIGMAIAIWLLAWWAVTRLGADMLFARGQQALAQKQFAQAADNLRQAVAWHGKTVYRVEWGRALLANKQLSLAAEVLRGVVQDSPGWEAAYIDLGLCYVGMQQHEAALEIWKKAVSLFPGSVTVHHNLAKLYLHIKRGETAYRHLLWIGLLQPGQRDELAYCLDLGLCHEARGEFKDALLQYSKAKELYPLQPWPYWQIGLWMERFQFRDQALYNWEKVIMLGQPPEQARAYWHMGRLYEAEHQNRMALDLYRRALSKDPHLQEAEQAILRMQSQIQDGKR